MFVSGTGQSELSRDQFVQVMKTEYPQLAKGEEGNMLALLFDSFDTDLSGSVDIEEFSIGIGKLTKVCWKQHVHPPASHAMGLVPCQGSTQEKLELLFEVYDADQSGSVSVDELVAFVSKASGEYEEAHEYTQQVRTATNQQPSSMSSIHTDAASR